MPAPNGHKRFQVVAEIKDDEWQKANVELDDLFRWEHEGGQIENQISEVYLVKLERSSENGSV